MEEPEEANYNQIDRMLNNQKPEKETEGMSIMEKLVASREKIKKQNQGLKEVEKGQERG